MKKYALVFYTHTDYKDVWVPLFHQTNKYYKTQKKYLFVNQHSNISLPENWHPIYYDDKQPYQQRFASCLKQIPEDIVLFHHEDMFLYSVPDYAELDDLADIVRNNSLDIVKLLRAEYANTTPVPTSYHKHVFENPSNLQFAIQPSICKKEKLLHIYEQTKGNTIWEFEALASDVVRKNKIKSCMYYTGSEKKRGMYHWDSTIYPYFATAVVKGKWNFSDYFATLKPLLIESKTNISHRGAT
jgi:hypothetical protein